MVSTAAATIRQAVAIVFDHAVLPAASAGAVVAAAGSSSGRESAALNLLRDLCEMCNGEHERLRSSQCGAEAVRHCRLSVHCQNAILSASDCSC